MANKRRIVNPGDKFGDFTIIKEVCQQKDKRRFLCKCICGKEKEVNLIHLTTGQTRSCGCYIPKLNKTRVGEKSATWKGGTYKQDGYVLKYKPDHPKAPGKGGYVREHVLVMEKKLGRFLEEGESVHHLNGVRDDNREKNLELWSTSQPYGQRVTDKIKWAKEILRLYGKK